MPLELLPPVTDDGFGNSWIFIREQDGVTGVTAFDLPFDELLKIAKAVA